MKEIATVPFESYLKKEQECEELKGKIEELHHEIEELKEKLKNTLEDRKVNYKRVDDMTMYGLSERMF